MRPRLVLLAALAALTVQAGQEPAPPAKEVAIPVDCGAILCVLPKPLWEALRDAHNHQVDTIERLEAELARLKADCRERGPRRPAAEPEPAARRLAFPPGRKG